MYTFCLTERNIFHFFLFSLNRWETSAQTASTNVTASTMKVAIVLQDSASACQAGRVQLNEPTFCDLSFTETNPTELNNSTVHSTQSNFTKSCVCVCVCVLGPRCREQCPQGRWGHQCNQSCSCLNSASCQPHNGVCMCKPGYWGSQCQHGECRSAQSLHGVICLFLTDFEY